MKDWEIITDNLSKAGWSYGYVSAIDCNGRTIWIVDARGYGILHRDKVRNIDEIYRLISREIDSAFREAISRNDLLQRVASINAIPQATVICVVAYF